jgi:hypothetical protein
MTEAEIDRGEKTETLRGHEQQGKHGIQPQLRHVARRFRLASAHMSHARGVSSIIDSLERIVICAHYAGHGSS